MAVPSFRWFLLTVEGEQSLSIFGLQNQQPSIESTFYQALDGNLVKLENEKKTPIQKPRRVRIFGISPVKVQTNHQKSLKTTITFTNRNAVNLPPKNLEVQESMTAIEGLQKVENWICDTFFHHQLPCQKVAFLKNKSFIQFTKNVVLLFKVAVFYVLHVQSIM